MVTIIVLLTVRDAAAFDLFEGQAVAIMAAHGGSLELAFRPSISGSGEAASADEIHVLKFPNLEAFERYRADKQLTTLSSLREKAIARTDVYIPASDLDNPAAE